MTRIQDKWLDYSKFVSTLVLDFTVSCKHTLFYIKVYSLVNLVYVPHAYMYNKYASDVCATQEKEAIYLNLTLCLVKKMSWVFSDSASIGKYLEWNAHKIVAWRGSKASVMQPLGLDANYSVKNTKQERSPVSIQIAT